ncbi:MULTISPECIES: hypothetical protein, partial [unclassified Flavobacterium]|uniref:hypothetical protein n=1 Tax=unclassified Flavobacterium TaxID=196869 RepID=UPI00131550D4
AGAALTGGNFWQGAVTGLVVSGLNHAMHQMDSPDDDVRINTKNKTAEVTRTGDGHDRIFVDGVEVMATPRGALGPELRDNGYSISMKGPQGVGMGLTDLVLDAFNLITGAGELKMGVTMLSKSSLGLKVLGGASKGTLKSSVFYKSVYGNAKISLFGGAVTRLPYVSPFGVGMVRNWSSFYGRNAALFGGTRATAGAAGLTNN